MKLLIADDDPDFVDVTCYALRRDGYDIVTAPDGVRARDLVRTQAPDLVVADSDLPRIDGYELCREIRRSGRTPVILLIPDDDENAVFQAFLEGADDCLRKPFSQKELAMRIRAVLARTHEWSVGPPARLVVGDLTLDLESHEVRCRGRLTRLPPLEFRILYLLALNAGRMVSSVRLVEYAWGDTSADPTKLKTYVSRIRRKLDLRSPSSTMIDSIHPNAYRLTVHQAVEELTADEIAPSDVDQRGSQPA